MTDSQVVSNLTCTQCGGELHPDQGQIFLVCPYCASTVYVDKTQVVFHFHLKPTFDAAKARAALARWMSGNDTVKYLDRKATIIEQKFEYLPFWYVRGQIAENQQQVFVFPAMPTLAPELRNLQMPAGDLEKYNPNFASPSVNPSIPLENALKSPGGGYVLPPQAILEKALVHIPLYTFKYQFKNKPYMAYLEAASGKTLAQNYPTKNEDPYWVVAVVTLIVMVILAVFPLIGAAINEQVGIAIGFLLCFGAWLVVAPVLYFWAKWVVEHI